MEILGREVEGLDLGLKSFINMDRTVDGEIRIGNLLEEWRTIEGIPSLMELLSTILRRVGVLQPGEEGGAYWISIGIRFGPQNDADVGDLAEIYKRFRGMFQVSSYATDASDRSGFQNAIVAFGTIVRSMMANRGLPPAVVFLRYTWTPDGNRPGRYEGEKGSTEAQRAKIAQELKEKQERRRQRRKNKR